LQHDAPPLLQQASFPPWQQQLDFAQQLSPPVVTHEVRDIRAALEAATIIRLRSIFMVLDCFVLFCQVTNQYQAWS
jgi:hypothetical protein